jgi:hypothetical protein
MSTHSVGKKKVFFFFFFFFFFFLEKSKKILALFNNAFPSPFLFLFSKQKY